MKSLTSLYQLTLSVSFLVPGNPQQLPLIVTDAQSNATLNFIFSGYIVNM